LEGRIVTQHVSADQWERYRSGNLRGTELLLVDDHMATCDKCRDLLAASPASFPTWAAGEPHLDYAQLQAYVDGESTAVEAAEVDAHVKDCASCRAELTDLQQWAASLKVPARKPVSRWIFAAAALAAGLVIALFAARSLKTVQRPLLVSLQDGTAVIGLDAEGRLSASAALAAPDRARLTEALRTGQLPLRPRPELQSKRSALSGARPRDSEFHLLSPLGYVVRQTHPRLTWQPLRRAESYKVQIFDSAYNLVERSPNLEGTSWTVVNPLLRGEVYSWQVTAIRGGQKLTAPQVPEPEARFEVLDASDEEALTKNQKTGHLLAALEFASLGLCEDTQAEIHALRSENASSELLTKMQANVAKSCMNP
jgi:hypothetical protein